jgi:hypothetical protein
MERSQRDNSADAHLADAGVLAEASAILRDRFTSGKYDDIAAAVRDAKRELISRSRHPSRHAATLKAVEDT